MLGTSFMEFKLDYSATKNIPIGNGIYMSDKLLVGGCTWTIVCFPRGSSGDLCNNGDYLSLFAMTTNNTRHGVKAVFQALPVGRGDGSPLLSHAKWSSKIIIEREGEALLGWYKFIKRSELESSYLVDGCVTFICGILDLNGNRVPVPPSDLEHHFGHMLECTDGSDVSFSVGAETFRAHRAILAARSPVFKALLFGSMADSQVDRITLHDIQPVAFRIMLWFLYTDTLPSNTELTKLVKDLKRSSATDLFQHLLAAADMYQVDRLKLMCAQKLWDCVSPENVAAMLVSAEMHNCRELKERCINFFLEEKNLKIALLTEGFLRLVQGFPSVIEEIKSRLV